MSSPVSRRTTLKVGAHAAWAVPAVTVASAAPAFAISGGPVLSLTGVTSSYGTDGEDAERPDRLDTLFTLKNTGTAAASNVVVSVAVPGGLHTTAPTLQLPSAEFTALPTTGSAGAGWLVRAMRATNLGAGQTCSLGSSGAPFRVVFSEALDASPYDRWAGKPFTATVQATATGTSPVSALPAVAASAPTYFQTYNYSGTRLNETVTVDGRISNFGRKTSLGPVQIQLSWEGGPPDGSRWTTQPGAATSAVLGPGTLSGDGSFGNPWTYTWSYAPPRATRQSFADVMDIEDPSIDAHADITFQVAITLGEPPGYTGRSDSRAMSMYVTGPDLRELPFLLGFDFVSGSDT